VTGTGGTVTGNGGVVTGTGGTVTGTGCAVTGTGGAVTRIGGAVTRTGDAVTVTGGAVDREWWRSPVILLQGGQNMGWLEAVTHYYNSSEGYLHSVRTKYSWLPTCGNLTSQ
jgi:hypothetical protein